MASIPIWFFQNHSNKSERTTKLFIFYVGLNHEKKIPTKWPWLCYIYLGSSSWLNVLYCEAGDMEKPGGSGTSSSSSVDPTTCSFNHNFLGKALHQKLRYLINYLISGKSEHKNFNIFYWTNTRTLSWNCSRNQHLDYLEPEPPQNRTFDVKYRPPPPRFSQPEQFMHAQPAWAVHAGLHLRVFVSNKIELHVPAF